MVRWFSWVSSAAWIHRGDQGEAGLHAQVRGQAERGSQLPRGLCLGRWLVSTRRRPCCVRRGSSQCERACQAPAARGRRTSGAEETGRRPAWCLTRQESPGLLDSAERWRKGPQWARQFAGKPSKRTMMNGFLSERLFGWEFIDQQALSLTGAVPSRPHLGGCGRPPGRTQPPSWLCHSVTCTALGLSLRAGHMAVPSYNHHFSQGFWGQEALLFILCYFYIFCLYCLYSQVD